MESFMMSKANLITFHCIIVYTDMIKSDYNQYTIDNGVHWITRFLGEDMYLAQWKLE